MLTTSKRVWPAFLVLFAVGCGPAELLDGTGDGSDESSSVSEAALIDSSKEWQFFDKLNAERAARGLPRLAMQKGLMNMAREWAVVLANKGSLSHRTNLGSDTTRFTGAAWTRAGENVGYGGSVDGLHTAFMNSPGHRDNILGAYNYVGIGVERRGTTIWVAVNFMQAPAGLATVSRLCSTCPRVALRSCSWHYVVAEGRGGRVVNSNRKTVGPWETFRLVDLGSGKVALQASNGMYVVAELGGGGAVNANRTTVGAWETFTRIDRGSGKIGLRTSNSRYLCAEYGGGAWVTANRTALGVWEEFTLVKL